MTRYAKSIAALLGALATWGITAAPDYTQVELWGLAAVLGTVIATFYAPYVPPAAVVEPPADAGRTLLGFIIYLLSALLVIALLVWLLRWLL